MLIKITMKKRNKRMRMEPGSRKAKWCKMGIYKIGHGWERGE